MTSSRLINEIKETVIDNATLFGFIYNGKFGNIDPFYTESEGNRFLLYFDGEEQTVDCIDDVFNTPFVDGHRLTEIADQITID